MMPLIQFYDRRVPLDEALDALAQALVTDHPSGVNAPQVMRRWATELRSTHRDAMHALARATAKAAS